MIVIDASAAIEWLLGTATGVKVDARLSARGETLHAPHLLDLEVAQVLRRFVATSALSETRDADALADLADVRLTRYPHDVLIPSVWRLRHNLTAYDAAYVALAEALEAPLVTCDGRLLRAPDHDAIVEVIRAKPARRP